MNRKLAGIVVALAMVAGMTEACSGSNGTNHSPQSTPSSDGGDHDGTTICGGSGKQCCNGTTCSAGLTCSEGTCSASSQADASAPADADAGPDAEAGPDATGDSAAYAEDAADDAFAPCDGDCDLFFVIQEGDSRSAGVWGWPTYAAFATGAGGAAQGQPYPKSGPPYSSPVASWVALDPTYDTAHYRNLALSGETLFSRAADFNNTGGPDGVGWDITATCYAINHATTKNVIRTLLECTNDLAGYQNLAPTNDASLSGSYPTWGVASLALTNLQTINTAVKACATRTYQTLCFTEGDRANTSTGSGAGFHNGTSQTTFETQMDLYASALLQSPSTYGCDAVYDLHGDPNLGCHGCANWAGTAAGFGGSAYWLSDGVHPNQASQEGILAVQWVPLAGSLVGP